MVPGAMTQNIYDNEEFFEGYSRLGRSVEGLDGAAGMAGAAGPAARSSRAATCWTSAAGSAGSAAGRDSTERPTSWVSTCPRRCWRAAAPRPRTAAITYTRADLEHLELSPASFGLVYSSLALHYIADLDRLLSQVYRALVAGGRLVFSVEHPIYTAPADPGWSLDTAGRKTWPVDGYLDEGPRSTDWLTTGVIKQHRTLATYVNLLVRLGFAIRHVEEWGPTPEQIASRPSLADERQRPPFLLVAARR